MQGNSIFGYTPILSSIANVPSGPTNESDVPCMMLGHMAKEPQELARVMKCAS